MLSIFGKWRDQESRVDCQLQPLRIRRAQEKDSREKLEPPGEAQKESAKELAKTVAHSVLSAERVLKLFRTSGTETLEFKDLFIEYFAVLRSSQVFLESIPHNCRVAGSRMEYWR
ncbi:hypothetical protein HHI36_015915 [Cryptolaemus montrouzieri]|uniref:Uncharacterized protein n=1 Tax=Cryptolaemus montrouzieri TaxID=559131 RepID=A0ABD2N7C9_9CUCU